MSPALLALLTFTLKISISNPFHGSAPFLFALEISEKPWFSMVLNFGYLTGSFSVKWAVINVS